MGIASPLDRAFALHDPHCWHVSLEFPMVAVCSSGARSLRGRGVAAEPEASNPACNRAGVACLDKPCRVVLSHSWYVCLSTDLDFYRACRDLVLFRFAAAECRNSLLGAGRNHILCTTRDVSLHPDKLRRSQV